MDLKSRGNPRSPHTGFKIVPERLCPGDILLLTDPKGPMSWAIALATGGHFSHAAICMKPPLFVEAHDPGVSVFHVGRFFVRDPKRIRILRLDVNQVPDAETKAKAAALYARGLRTEAYDWDGALRSKLPGPASKDGFFCSQLVAEAYRRAGHPLMPGDRPSHKITPADIERAAKLGADLKDVTDEVLVRINLPPNHGLRILDGPFSSQLTPAHEHDQALRLVTEIVADALAERGWLERGGQRPTNFLEARDSFLIARSWSRGDEIDAIFAESLAKHADPVLEKHKASVLEELEMPLPDLTEEDLPQDEESLRYAAFTLAGEINSTKQRLGESAAYIACAQEMTARGGPTRTLEASMTYEETLNEIAHLKIKRLRECLRLLRDHAFGEDWLEPGEFAQISSLADEELAPGEEPFVVVLGGR